MIRELDVRVEVTGCFLNEFGQRYFGNNLLPGYIDVQPEELHVARMEHPAG